MAGICENGHRSTTDDYCDTCGAPVHAAPSPAPVRSAAPSTTQKCPNCGASNPADALFCEACGYDYTTGTLPRSDVAGMLGLRRGPVPAPSVSAPVAAPVVSLGPSPAPVPSSSPSPAPVLSSTPSPAPVVTATPSYPGASSATPVAVASQLEIDESSAAPVVSEPIEVVSEPVAVAAVEPTASDATGSESLPALTPPEPAPGGLAPMDDEEPTRGRPAPRRESYVAEIWIDPDWYEVQETDEPMPSVALPATVVLGVDNLIGRASASRNIHPEVDCGVDSGVSRRQSRLSTDATRWYVEDLGSANGTFVGPASGPLPTAPIQGRYELGPDDRIYVGAWTRIVVRKASKDEVDSLS